MKFYSQMTTEMCSC